MGGGVGSSVGWEYGTSEGAGMGIGVGTGTGAAEGLSDGTSVGSPLGRSDGIGDGSSLGEDGTTVGSSANDGGNVIVGAVVKEVGCAVQGFAMADFPAKMNDRPPDSPLAPAIDTVNVTSDTDWNTSSTTRSDRSMGKLPDSAAFDAQLLHSSQVMTGRLKGSVGLSHP